jgi:hypothetical protein
MSVTGYITTLMTLIISVWFIPDWQELFKVYVISTIAFITLIVNLLFRIQKLRELIVRILVTDVKREILNDPDIQKIIEQRLRRAAFKRRIKELRKQREAGNAK